MIKNFDNNTRKSDAKILTWIIIGFIFVIWLCTPPGNKFIQLCFWGNNTQFLIAKLTNNDETTAYKFYRNNAIYLARMNQQKQALKEMDKSIESYPTYMPEKTLQSLYKDRAQLRMFYKNYKGALDDYLKVENLDLTDKFKLAMLYKVNGKNKYALSYCNSILSIDANAYSGYLCLADIYANVQRYDASVKIFDLLIDRNPKKGKYYADRAQYKKLMGDVLGYETDISKASRLAPNTNLTSSLVDETLNPKVLNLTIY